MGTTIVNMMRDATLPLTKVPTQETIVTADGYGIGATLFSSDIVHEAPTNSQPPKGVVIIAAAMGVSQRYYQHFGQWLSQQGYSVLTFDYRGIGLSSPGSLRGFRTSICDWAQFDCAAVVARARQLADNLPLYWIGHSLGGQIIGMVPNCSQITKAVTVASGNGYWREVESRQKLKSLWMWFVAVPLALFLFDYFPGKKLRKVGDLPGGVIAQWRRWCLSPRYLFDNEGREVIQRYADIHFPITSLSFTDDEMMTDKGIKTVHEFYRNAPQTLKVLHPRTEGVEKIGHFGFFRRHFEDTLWPTYIIPELVA